MTNEKQKETHLGDIIHRTLSVLVCFVLAGGVIRGLQMNHEMRESKRQRNDNYERIFKPYGLADINRDGETDVHETSQAYKDMNIGYTINFSIRPDRIPTQSDLTKYIDAHTTKSQLETQ